MRSGSGGPSVKISFRSASSPSASAATSSAPEGSSSDSPSASARASTASCTGDLVGRRRRLGEGVEQRGDILRQIFPGARSASLLAGSARLADLDLDRPLAAGRLRRGLDGLDGGLRRWRPRIEHVAEDIVRREQPRGSIGRGRRIGRMLRLRLVLAAAGHLLLARIVSRRAYVNAARDLRRLRASSRRRPARPAGSAAAPARSSEGRRSGCRRGRTPTRARRARAGPGSPAPGTAAAGGLGAAQDEQAHHGEDVEQQRRERGEGQEVAVGAGQRQRRRHQPVQHQGARRACGSAGGSRPSGGRRAGRAPSRRRTRAPARVRPFTQPKVGDQDRDRDEAPPRRARASRCAASAAMRLSLHREHLRRSAPCRGRPPPRSSRPTVTATVPRISARARFRSGSLHLLGGEGDRVPGVVGEQRLAHGHRHGGEEAELHALGAERAARGGGEVGRRALARSRSPAPPAPPPPPPWPP